ncbi:MAG: hypothetical protein J6K58_14995 [Lachnospiraceae bacterium]|nr:hypothetical protein [Lachnospiraceae bacterium]
MKKTAIRFLIGALALGMLTGCGKKEEEKITAGVVQRMEEEPEEEEKEKKDQKPAQKEDEEASEGSILDDAEVLEDGSESEDQNGPTVGIAIGGFRVQVPGEYGYFIDDTRGPIVYRDDLFVLMFLVRDGSYDEKIKEPDALMKGAKDSGGTITKEIEEITIDGKPYAYFTYSNEENDFIVVYTAAADSDKRLCAQILIKSDEVSDKEILERWAAMASTAEETGEPDTTQEDLDELRRISYIGEQKEESTLEYDGVTVAFKVEPGFYSTYEDADEIWTMESFLDSGLDVDISCYLKPDTYGEGAEHYIQIEADNTRDDNAVVSSVKVADHTFFYIEERYTSDGDEFQRIEAACDIGDGYIYQISLCAIDYEKELHLDDIKTFLSVKEK